MEGTCLVQRGNKLEVKLSIKTERQGTISTFLSPEYVINGTTVFQAKVVGVYLNDRYGVAVNNFVFIRFTKCHTKDNVTYVMNFTSAALAIKKMIFTSDDTPWRLVNENKNTTLPTIDVTVKICTARKTSTFSTLHQDTKLSDFELRGKDGSVQFHKTVLAASSPVLKQMLEGTWRETTKGHIDLPETSKKTLQHFKDYIYLNNLPKEDLEQLLMLASYYMMPDLEQRCVDKLVENLNAKNACDLLEFATRQRVPRLLIAILECVQKCSIDLNEMRDHILPETSSDAADTEKHDKNHDAIADEEDDED